MSNVIQVRYTIATRELRARYNPLVGYGRVTHSLLLYILYWYVGNWASEASPTLGCSIEISRDICMYIMCVCRGPKSVGGITWAKRAHAQSQFWAVKSNQ